LVVPQNFVECDGEQVFLMPPSLREWLPEDHLAWFVLDAVAEMDLDRFYADYRADGHGRAAYEPSMMVALLLYAYATEQRSARAIERHCRQDVAYRVICANRVPDHATIARFVVRHEAALAELFGSVLALCARAGLVSTGVVAIDATKLTANASREANLDYERVAREILAEAKATDEAEDELFGEARGDELPEELRTSAGRRKWLREAKRSLEAEGMTDPRPSASRLADESASMPRGRALNQGRRGWLRDARQRLDERREREARPIPRSRQARLAESRRRLEEELVAERSANEAYEAYRSRGISRAGRRFGGDPPSPHQVPDTPAGKINSTDPDSRLLKAPGIGYVQGYNAQAAVNEKQIRARRRDQRRIARLRAPRADGRHHRLRATAGGRRRQAEGGGGGRRLLAPRADGQPRRRWHPGPDPPRRRQAKQRPARLAGRPLRVDAHSARNRARPAALQKTLADGRADVRAHQAQPRHEQVPPTRQVRGAHRMAPDRGHSQPHQAPQPHPGARNGVSRAKRPAGR
jgi:transposase